MRVSPVALMLALLAKMRQPRTAPAAKFRCRLCKAPVGPEMSAVDGCAVHPANNCRFGKKGSATCGPCAIPRFMAEPIGLDVFIKGDI